jgi:hypothetical protein
MQRRLRLLSIAFIAGLAAVIVAAVPLFVKSAPPQQIQYVKVSHFDMPGMGVIKLFVHNIANSTTETTTVGPTRQRTDSGDTSEIIQCDLKRVVHLDNKNKTYYAMTFDQMQAAMQQAMQNMPKTKGMTPAPATSMAPIHGSGSLSLNVTTQEDPQPQPILGMNTRHVTTTVTTTMNGSGDCPNGSATMKTDEWFIPNEIHFSCPLPNIPVLRGGPAAPSGNPMAANPCLSAFHAQANDKIRSGDHFNLKQDTSLELGPMKLATHEEVTKYQKSPYDPAFFDVPAGYTQVQPPSMGGH